MSSNKLSLIVDVLEFHMIVLTIRSRLTDRVNKRRALSAFLSFLPL